VISTTLQPYQGTMKVAPSPLEMTPREKKY